VRSCCDQVTVVSTKLYKGMMTKTNIKTSMINDRTTLMLVNQWRNLLNEASMRMDVGCNTDSEAVIYMFS